MNIAIDLDKLGVRTTIWRTRSTQFITILNVDTKEKETSNKMYTPYTIYTCKWFLNLF